MVSGRSSITIAHSTKLGCARTIDRSGNSTFLWWNKLQQKALKVQVKVKEKKEAEMSKNWSKTRVEDQFWSRADVVKVQHKNEPQGLRHCIFSNIGLTGLLKSHFQKNLSQSQNV